MLIRQGRWKSIFGFSTEQNAGVAKLAVLLSLAVFLIFLIFTVGVQQTKAAECDCGSCHGTSHHADDINWQGCSGCHESPPQTPAHLTHYNSSPLKELVYGDTAVSSVDNAYKFGCGNCHPLDNTYHIDNTVQVELYNTESPVGSIKAKNHEDAAYNTTTKTCNNVYCHSGFVVTSSSPVGDPLTYPENPIPPGYKLNIVRDYYTGGFINYIMDETCSNLTYAAYTVTSGREYKTTPAWGTTGSFSLCTECHQFPLMSNFSTVEAGVGDSHYWNNEYGYSYGHENNMEYFPGIPCATCHSGTADHRNGAFPPYPLDATNTPTFWTELNSPTYWTQMTSGNWIQAYYTVPLKSRVMHVNGSPDVSFDTVNNYRYFLYCPPGNPYCWNIDEPYGLSTAAYEPDTKTCSNVSCHQSQQNVQWGSPYRGWEGPSAECDQCHRMGYLNPTCE